MSESEPTIVSVLRKIHDALGVAEHFSPPVAQAAEEVAEEVIDTVATEVKKQDGAD